MAISSPEAERKPPMTGWLRKLAKKPRRSMPMAVSISPDSSASTSAASTYAALPGVATLVRAAPVIRAMIATGPTASERLVPSMA